MTHRRQNFMGGAAILAGAVAVTKLLGALYKIPLGNLLDREGMAHFYAAYNIYSLLLVLSTAGLPVPPADGGHHRGRAQGGGAPALPRPRDPAELRGCAGGGL